MQKVALEAKESLRQNFLEKQIPLKIYPNIEHLYLGHSKLLLLFFFDTVYKVRCLLTSSHPMVMVLFEQAAIS